MWHDARMDTKEWDARVDAWYEASFDESQPAETVARMRELLAQHPNAGALIPFELAGVHDTLGLENEAVPLYEQALAEGLIPTLPRYRRSLSGYAAALTDNN